MYPEESAKKKKAFVIVEFTVTALMILVMAFMLLTYFSFRDIGSTPKIFGYYIFQTKAVTMAPEIPAGTAVFAKASEIDKIGPNSVVLCRIDNTATLILVVDVLEEEGGTFYVVRYKTSPPNDTYKIPKESIMAKALFYDDFSGKFITFATSKSGIIIAVIAPSLIIILLQIIRIVLSNRETEAANLSWNVGSERMSSEDASKNIREHRGSGDSLAAKAVADAYTKMAEKTSLEFSEEDSRGRELSFSEMPVKHKTEPAHPLIMQPIRAEFDKPSFDPKESILAVDRDGRAEYAPRDASEEVLLTGDKLYASHRKLEFSAGGANYLNEPVRIQEETADSSENSDIKELLTTAADDFKPAVSDVLPEGIKKIRTLSFSEDEPEPEKKPKRSAPEEEKPPAEFFKLEKEEEKPQPAPEESEHPVVKTNSIPEKAVRPREAIAPRRKHSSGKTIDELMNMIDVGQKKVGRAQKSVGNVDPALLKAADPKPLIPDAADPSADSDRSAV